MLSPRWRKVLRDLWSSKTRTVLVVLSVAVGVFAVGMIAGTSSILSRELTSSYAASVPASAHIFTEPFDEDLVDSVANTPGVRLAEGAKTIGVRVKLGPSQWKNLQLTVVPDNRLQRIGRATPEQGAWPPGKREIAIERASLGELRTAVGATLVVEAGEGKQRELRVVGSVHDLTSPPPAIAGGETFGFINQDTGDMLGVAPEFTELRIVVSEHADNKEHIQKVTEKVSDKIKRSGRKVFRSYVPDPGKHPADTIVQPVLLLLGVMGFLSLLLSGFLVVNTISAILAQQVRQIGIMKTIGGRTGQITGMYVASILVFGGLSLLVAIPLGAIAGEEMARWLGDFLNSDITDARPDTSVFLIEATVGVVVPLLAALWPIVSGTRVTVREALSEYGISGSNMKLGLFDRFLQSLGFLSRPLLLSLRNTFRRRGRLTLTLMTLTLAGSIFIGVFSVRESLLGTLDEALDYFAYDVGVTFARQYRIDRLEREIRSVPGVITVESWEFSVANRVRPDGTKGNDLFIIAPPAGTQLLKPTIVGGRWLLPEDEGAAVVNTLVLKDEKDLKLGETITVKLDDKDYTLRIVGLVRGVMTGPIVYVNYPYFARITHRSGMASGAQAVTAGHSLEEQKAIAKVMEERLEAAGMRVTRTESIAEQRQIIANLFDILVAVLSVMAVLLAVVGGLGLMGTMSINVLERTREIGVMRAIGASDGAVRRIVIVEGVLIGLISWVIGAVLAYPLGSLLSDAVGQSVLRSPLTYTFSLTGTMIWLAVVVGIATLASLLPAWNASRLSVREALAYG